MKSLARMCALVGTLALIATQSAAIAQTPAAAPSSAPVGAPPGLGAGPGGTGRAGFGSGLGTQNTRPIPPFVGPPAGTKPLAIDMFTSKNFYKDRASWTDPRYFRCNTPREMVEYMWETGRIGTNPPVSASWGNCSINFPREKIVSPYPYKTAQDHYAALLAAAKAHGGPTLYTKATTPDWDGFYSRDQKATDFPGVTANDRVGTPLFARLGLTGERWFWGGIDQSSTIVSLLTPEYQKRYVQMLYHETVDNSKQWNAEFCYPEGFTRWWAWPSRGDQFQLTVTVNQVQFISGIADNFLREVLIGRDHVQKVPQWYGETVGFWDGTTLVAWTANIQAWTQHTLFENSGKLETIEKFTPVLDDGGKFIGIEDEAVFYDPEALLQPVVVKDRFLRRATADDPKARYTFIECLTNIKNVDGRPKQTSKNDPEFIDYYGRPWAQVWERYFEKGWDKPDDLGVPDDVLKSLQ